MITLGRAARVHRLASLLAGGPTPLGSLLEESSMGLRTFYRELGYLKKCGIGVRRSRGSYWLATTLAEAEEKLPFPDPHLSFAEMALIAAVDREATLRLGALYRSVVEGVDR